MLRWTERGLYLSHASLIFSFLLSSSKELSFSMVVCSMSQAGRARSLYQISQIHKPRRTGSIRLLGQVPVRQTLHCWPVVCHGLGAVGTGSPIQSGDSGQSLLVGVLSEVTSLCLVYWEAALRGCGRLPFLPYGPLVSSVPGPCWK